MSTSAAGMMTTPKQVSTIMSLSANGASSAITYDAPEPQEEEQPEEQSTTPPSADDSSIWDFGGGNSGSGSDDDDMSSDFGGFGGF